MLPSELLVARSRQGVVEPVFVDVNEVNLAIAEDLTNTFKTNVGNRKKELMKCINNLEEVGFDYRFIRGMAVLLERSCTFESRSVVEPVLARRRVFEEAGRSSPAFTNGAKSAILDKVAKEMGVSKEELEGSLWADLEEEQILTEFSPVSPGSLLKLYNLSLLQTLLFRATYLESVLEEGWKNVLRYAKYLGLMYTARVEEGGVVLRFDGPSSLFKLNDRYGTAFARLMPAIVSNEGWKIRAEILARRNQGKRLLTLDLSSRQLAGRIEGPRERRDYRDTLYDSNIEMVFARSFDSLKTGWKLLRECEPIVAGNQIFIPDFTFESAGIKVHLEIVGFWTQDYLERKLQKLRLLHNLDVIVAIDEHLACSRFKDLPGRLIIFKGKVPLKPILDFLQSKKKKLKELQAESLKEKQIQPDADQMTITDLADKYGILVETTRQLFKQKAVKDYLLVGDTVVSERKLAQLKAKMTENSDLKLSTALRIIEDEGLKEPFQILEHLGYSVRWNRLVPEEDMTLHPTTQD